VRERELVRHIFNRSPFGRGNPAPVSQYIGRRAS
jgi:hypothetical protein